MFNHAEKLAQILHEHQPTGTVWVAYSGGLDSRVLLEDLAQLRPHLPQLQLKAIHVNHGLSPNAGRWAEHCQQSCQQLAIACEIRDIDLSQASKQRSVEEAARTLRYQLFAELLNNNDLILTAHTCDDQAETLLLQLLRGSGVKGMASMPLEKKLGKGLLLRPFLDVFRADLLTFALAENLCWIEDESNFSMQYDRNYLRHKIFPLLEQRWPASKNLLARAAYHAAESDQLLMEIAASDLLTVSNGQGQLILTLLKKLSYPRQKNLLRFWLQQQNFLLPSQIKLQQILQEVIHSKQDAQALVTWSTVEVRRFQDLLYALPTPTKAPNKLWLNWDMQQPLVLPNNQGVLFASGLDHLPRTTAIVKYREGGERFHPQHRVGSHPLKKLFQEWQVPPWQRNTLPLVFLDDLLLAVPGFACHHAYPDLQVSIQVSAVS